MSRATGRGAHAEAGDRPTRRAAIYCRVSSQGQAEDDKASRSEQLAACEAEGAGADGSGPVRTAGEAGRQLARLQQQKLEVARQRIRGGIDDATLDTLQTEVEAQTASWQGRFDAEQRLRADVEAQRRALEDAAAHLRLLSDHVARRLEALTFAERRALLEALVDRIWIDGQNRITIEGVLDGAGPAFPLAGPVPSVPVPSGAAPGNTRVDGAAPGTPHGGRHIDCSTALSRAIM